MPPSRRHPPHRNPSPCEELKALDWAKPLRFCKKCQTDHEEEKRFCPQCGSFLIKKESFPRAAEPEDLQSVEERPKEKFICPECHIIYEKAKSCIRCGTDVVPISSHQVQKEQDRVPELQAETESQKVSTPWESAETALQHLICPSCRKEHLGGKSCIRCGTELVPIDSPPSPPKKERTKSIPSLPPKRPEVKIPPSLERTEDLLEEEGPEVLPSKRTVADQLREGRLLRKVRRDYPRTILNWSGMAIIGIAIGYFLWSTYSHLVPPKPDPAHSPASQQVPTPPTSSAIPPSGPTEMPPEVTGSIKSLLDNIRTANLRKDINLFLSCYAKDFKDREGKRRATLGVWEKYTFIDLQYDLKDLSQYGDQVKARVEWWFKFLSTSGGPHQENRTIFEAVFKREEGGWKISEIKSES